MYVCKFFVPLDGLSVSVLVLLLLLLLVVVPSVPPRKSAKSIARPFVCRDFNEDIDEEDEEEEGGDANVVERCFRADRSP
jgi:hypothetical protein